MKSMLTAGLFASLLVGVSAQPQGLVEARNQMDAAAAKGDKAVYAKFLSEDFTWVDRSGRLRNKAAVVEELAPQVSQPAPQASPEIRSYGNAAVLVGTRSQPDGTDTYYMQAWVKNGNQWQMVAHQGLQAGNQPAPAATKPSSPLPASSGVQAERDAVQKNHEAVGEANQKADLNMFAAAVTDQFVAFGPSGPLSKQQRMDAIKKAGPQANVGAAPSPARSIRIHGNLAVTTQRTPQADATAWVTTVSVKDGTQWKRAGTIRTPITGAAQTSSR